MSTEHKSLTNTSYNTFWSCTPQVRSALNPKSSGSHQVRIVALSSALLILIRKRPELLKPICVKNDTANIRKHVTLSMLIPRQQKKDPSNKSVSMVRFDCIWLMNGAITRCWPSKSTNWPAKGHNMGMAIKQRHAMNFKDLYSARSRYSTYSSNFQISSPLEDILSSVFSFGWI